jgi:hypothetical protein
VAENENENSKLQEENFSLSYTPYEDILSNKFENEIEEPPPNTQEYFSLVIDDENPQEPWQQEQLVEEMNLEKNDEQDGHYMKEKSFQDIVDESRILDVDNDKERNERMLFDWKLSIQSKTIIFLSSQELISLNYGSKALLEKQHNQILNTPCSIFLQYILRVPLTQWYKFQYVP